MTVKFKSFFKHIFRKELKMGQQLNKIQKRQRRKAYLVRCKVKIAKAIKAAAKKK